MARSQEVQALRYLHHFRSYHLAKELVHVCVTPTLRTLMWEPVHVCTILIVLGHPNLKDPMPGTLWRVLFHIHATSIVLHHPDPNAGQEH